MQTRTRSLFEVHGPIPATFRCHLGDHHYTPYDSYTWYVPSEYVEYFREEYTPNSLPGQRHAWKSFEHYKVSRSNTFGGMAGVACATESGSAYSPHLYHCLHYHNRFGATGFIPSGAAYFPFGEPNLPINGLTGVYDKRADGSFVPPPANLDELKQRSLRSMLPLIKAELSLLNSIYELKDWAFLPRALRRLSECVKRIHRDVLPIYRSARLSFGRLKQPTLRDIFRTGANGYLQGEFNIRPLLSDICGIQTALKRTERRINDLITRSGRVQRKHFGYQWNELSDGPSEYSDVYLSLSPYSNPGIGSQKTYHRMARSTQSSASVFHAEIEYNFNYTQYQIEHARLLAYLDAFGVNLNPAIIWNAIPWSFVVDWVLGVSRWLDQFAMQNMEPQINILRYLWSVKRERWINTSKITYSIVPTVYPVQWPTVPMPTVHETSYKRVVEMPSSSSIISSGVSSHEFTLGAALVIARRRRRK